MAIYVGAVSKFVLTLLNVAYFLKGQYLHLIIAKHHKTTRYHQNAKTTKYMTCDNNDICNIIYKGRLKVKASQITQGFLKNINYIEMLLVITYYYQDH